MSNAPLPLGYVRAVEKAAELRRRGTHWSWPTIADTMLVYHGWDRHSGWWSEQVRALDRDCRLSLRGTPYRAAA